MSRSHSFSVDVAGAYSVDVALMLQHICFWYEKVVSDDVNKFKNEHWVRMKLTQMNQQFPYWGISKIRHLIDKMLDEKLIKKGEFNTKKNDRTKWYTLTQKGKNLLNISGDKSPKKVTAEIGNNKSAEIGSLTAEIGNSKYKEVDIKDRYYYYNEKIVSNKSLLEIIAMQNRIKIDTIKNKINEFVLHCKSVSKNHDNDGDIFNHFSAWIRKQKLTDQDLETELNWFMKVFNQISNSKYKISDTIKQRFANQFAVGFTGDEMKIAIRNLYSSSPENSFHIKSKFKFATPEYLLKDDNMNKYLNFKI
jgi:hypothetical protein